MLYHDAKIGTGIAKTLVMTDNYRNLKVWQRSIDLTKEVYRLSGKFPREELYGLTSQIRRASVSVPSNIAEGHARHTDNEFHKFLTYSIGSLAEIDTQLEIAVQLDFVTSEQTADLKVVLTECRKMLVSLEQRTRA